MAKAKHGTERGEGAATTELQREGTCASSTSATSTTARANEPSQLFSPLPPLVSVSPDRVEVFPCGVVIVREAVPLAERQRLWDAVVCAGFDHRDVSANGTQGGGPNMWYTQAAGAPDILLHYNYYEPPSTHQPPPMPLLCAADSIFQATSLLEIAQVALEPRDNGVEDEAGGEGEAGDGTARRVRRHEKAPWVDEAATNAAALAEAAAKRSEDERNRLLWPRRPNFRSVLAIGYRPSDTFRWHTDLAGEDGWVCSISVGASAIFEYLPTVAPSALRRARARTSSEETVRLEVHSGDALLFHGGMLAHRLRSVVPSGDVAQLEGMHMDPYVRLNLQTRVYGARDDAGLRELLERGFDYVH
jgi:alkylated DNA repair dioxygenase AlkB